MGEIFENEIIVEEIDELGNYFLECFDIIYEGKKYKGNSYYYKGSTYILTSIDSKTDEVKEVVKIHSNTGFVVLLKINKETIEIFPINKSIKSDN